MVSLEWACSWSCDLFKFGEIRDFFVFVALRAVPLQLHSFLQIGTGFLVCLFVQLTRKTQVPDM